MAPHTENKGLDGMDRKILEVLQKDATRAVGQLADEIGLSKSACWRRIQALEQHGIITARVALLDQHKLGLNLTVYTAIRTLQHTKDWYDDFSAVVMTMPNVMEVHRMMEAVNAARRRQDIALRSGLLGELGDTYSRIAVDLHGRVLEQLARGVVGDGGKVDHRVHALEMLRG